MSEPLVCDRCKIPAEESDEECWNCGNKTFVYELLAELTKQEDKG